MKAKSAIVLFLIATYAGGCGDRLLSGADPDMLPEAPQLASVNENLVVVGAGLSTQPVTLDFTVPVSSGTDILAARLRWVGRGMTPTGDPFLLVNGHQRAATLLASYQVAGDPSWVFFYECDALLLVRPGANRLFVSGFDLGAGSRPDGVGVFVVYRDALSPWTSVLLADPHEFVQAGQGSVWSFPIGTSIAPRNGKLVLFAGDALVTGTDRVWWSAGPGAAPSSLVGTAPNVIDNALSAALGQRMDILSRSVAIPGWASHFAYQIESPSDGSGDSIAHFFSALCSDGVGTFCTGSIAGRVFHDDDRDGLEDAGEPGIAGVSVQLKDGGGAVLTASPTDGSGAFSFAPLCTAGYVVEVDPASLPAGVDPTSCGVGDCSPLTVTVPADDAAVAGIAFGYSEPAPPPVPTYSCFFGLGFWKHEFRFTSRATRQGAHIDVGTLESLLPAVQDATQLDWTGGDGVLSSEDVAVVLNRTDTSVCAISQAHYLACLLNYALSGAPSSLMVDTDADGVVDMTWGEMIDAADALFSQRDATGCIRAKAMAASVNAMPSEDCPYSD